MTNKGFKPGTSLYTAVSSLHIAVNDGCDLKFLAKLANKITEIESTTDDSSVVPILKEMIKEELISFGFVEDIEINYEIFKAISILTNWCKANGIFEFHMGKINSADEIVSADGSKRVSMAVVDGKEVKVRDNYDSAHPYTCRKKGE